MTLVASSTIRAGVPLFGFDVPETCATKQEFLQLVRERLPPGVHDVPDFELRVAAARAGFAGRLLLAGPTARELFAENCVEILDATAVILALRAERLQEEQAQQAQQAQPAEPRPDASWLPRTEPGAPTPDAPSSTTPGPQPQRHAVAAAPSPSPTWRVGAGGASLGKVAPGTALGPSLTLGVATDGRLAGGLRLTLDRTATGTVTAPSGAGTWARLSAARVSGCALELRYGVGRLQPCLQFGAGLFEAGGVAGGPISEVSSTRRPWLSVGPTVRAEVQWSRRWLFAAEAGALAPLLEQELSFRTPDSTIHASGWFTSYVGLTVEFVVAGSKQPVSAMAR